MLIIQLSGSTHGSNGDGQGQGTGQANAVTTASHSAASNNSLYDQAMGDFQRGGYAEALEKFKAVLQQESGESSHGVQTNGGQHDRGRKENGKGYEIHGGMPLFPRNKGE